MGKDDFVFFVLFYFFFNFYPKGHSQVQSIFEVKAPSDGESNYPPSSQGGGSLHKSGPRGDTDKKCLRQVVRPSPITSGCPLVEEGNRMRVPEHETSSF